MSATADISDVPFVERLSLEATERECATQTFPSTATFVNDKVRLTDHNSRHVCTVSLEGHEWFYAESTYRRFTSFVKCRLAVELHFTILVTLPKDILVTPPKE